MNAKEIGRAAGRIFAYHLPPHWIFRSQEDQEDYGIDGEIEIASPEDKATGFIFKAQIKGQQKVSYINQGTHVSFDLPVDRLRYYMRQIETPIILVVVDVTDKKIFWASLQDNPKIAEDLTNASEKGQKTVAVHLRSEDIIPERTNELLVAVERNMDWLRLHALDRLTGPIDSLISRAHDDVLKTLLEKSKKLSFEIYNENFERLFRNEEFPELFSSAKDVIHSATELVETRLTAGLYIERLFLREPGRRDPRGIAALSELYAVMLTIVRRQRAPVQLRRYVLMLIRALRLQVSVDSDYHYFASATQFSRDSLTGWILASSRSQVSGRAAHDVQKTIFLINRAILDGQHGLFLDALPRLISSIALFTYRLRKDSLQGQADYLASWLKFCVDLAIDLARETGNVGALSEMITLNALSNLDDDGKPTRIEESLALSKTIEDPAIREGIQKHLRGFKDQNEQEHPELTPDQEIEGFRSRAIGLGFNVDDPNDEFGQVIKQGLLDHNPERVIKNCESLVMIPTRALGVPAQMVGLPSAAMKFLYCLKKGNAMGGWRLDDIYLSPVPGMGFKAQFCDTCDLRQTRSESWVWTSQWQQRLAEDHSDIFDRLSRF